MFKKTLIAAAVATLASSVAMADVSVGGKVEQNFTWTDSATRDADEMNGGTDAILTFKGSEDLGNGMSAFADIQTRFNGAAGAQTTFDTKVGLTGGFGTVVMGRMEDFSESKVLGMADVFGGTSVELGGNNAGRNDNGLAYISPTVNGLHVAIAGYALDSTGTIVELGTEPVAADMVGGTDDINDIDATDIAVMYSNGPLAVNIAQEKTKDSNAATNNDEKITSFGVGYTMGDLKVSAVYQDIENAAFVAADDHNDTMLTAVYSMGNNSIALGWNEDELTTGATDNNTTALELRHNFSARTRAYVGMTQDDFATAANETDTVYMGLEHSF